MRHEFTRRCVTLGSALAIGLAAVTASARAQETDAEPKQKALVSFKWDLLSRFKKDEQTGAAQPAEAKSDVVPASAVEPLPAGSTKAHAVPATNAKPAQPLPPTSLVTGQNASVPALPLPTAAAQEQFPSVLPPSVPPVQLVAGQFPLPAAGQMPFQSAQSPVVIMMPAGWQPDGSYTFAPRTVLSPEVPAEHWPTSQRNPMGDGSRKGLFDWPQIAKKITNSTIGEPDIKPQPAPAVEQPNSKALFAVAAPSAPQSAPVTAQAMPAVSQERPATAPAPQPATQPASKALFAPPPKQPEPQPEESKTRALFSLLSRPMSKPAAAPSSTGSKALFAFGRKKEEPAAAPVPAVVPQYATETPMPPPQNMPTVTPTTTVESTDPELQPPAPPSVANPLPGTLQTAKSDNPKMKWRAKGAPAEPVLATDAVKDNNQETVTVQASKAVNATSPPAVTPATAVEAVPGQIPSAAAADQADQIAANLQPTQHHGHHQPMAEVTTAAPVSRERSLLGKHFPTMSTQTPRNVNDSRSPWRRQAERDAAAAAEKKVEQPVANSKAILPNVAALLPALEKPSRPVQPHLKPEVTTVAGTEDALHQPHPVRQAHAASARSTDSYYAAPWESEVEAELEAVERRQMGTGSNRRAAVARQTMEREQAAFESQPRVPFEIDELEQEKAVLRRSAKASKPAASVGPKATNPAGTPSNGARMAEQRSKKSYRRLTGEDMKQGFTRPLDMFSDMTRLPSPLKAAADNLERRQNELADENTGAEVEQDELYYERTERPAPPKRSPEKRQPVHELRQSTAAAASVTKLEDRELLTSDQQEQPTSVGQRGGRRQVERTARPIRVQNDLEEQEEADPGVVTADDADDQEPVEELDDERPVRPATHIRNKHGNRVKIFTGGAATGDLSDE